MDIDLTKEMDRLQESSKRNKALMMAVSSSLTSSFPLSSGASTSEMKKMTKAAKGRQSNKKVALLPPQETRDSSQKTSQGISTGTMIGVQNESKNMNILDLPNEILTELFLKFFSYEEIANLRPVCLR
jgi:hypothetical protein